MQRKQQKHNKNGKEVLSFEFTFAQNSTERMNKEARWSLILMVALISCGESEKSEDSVQPEGVESGLRLDGEDHFTALRQLTFGGDNAEAYWSFGNDQLVFQANNPSWGTGCDQIFVLPLDVFFDFLKLFLAEPNFLPSLLSPPYFCIGIHGSNPQLLFCIEDTNW